MSKLLSLYQRITRWPAGHWLFSRAICLKAPYFATIAPCITVLEPGRCEARIAHRRRVQNHLGTVHAIALCNLAELVAGVMVDAGLPASMRWIPKGMQVEYLKKATGTMHAIALPAVPLRESSEGYNLPVEVAVRNTAGEAVFQARIMMWVSPRQRAAA
jgi:acyl-coenzyme A thioesterase PaaI-like protein